MACDNLTYAISFSNTTPALGSTITCACTVQNLGTTTEKFHVEFSQQGGTPFYTSPVQTIRANATLPVITNFLTTVAGTVTLCATLVCDTVPSGNAPVAAFTATPLSGETAPVNVQFTDQSTGSPTSWHWDMSDGDGTLPENSMQNPAWRFWDIQSYTISLTVANAYGSNTVTKTNYITVGTPATPSAPIADFTATPTSGSAPLVVSFTDASTGNPTGYQWDFLNNGVIESTTGAPSWTYSSNGTYSVKLTVTNAQGSNSIVKNGFITVSSGGGSAPVASFNATPVSGTLPLNVQFTSTSTGSPTGYSLSFGDGSSSSAQAPLHTYAAAGTYTVTLTVSNTSGSNTATKSSFITVTAVSPPPVNTGFGCPATVAFNGVQYAIGGSRVYTTSDGKSRGGGTQYPAFTAGVAGGSYSGNTVSTKADLIAAMGAARSPAVIYVSPSANIDMGSTENVSISAGVTVASNRGVGGSRGGRIFSKSAGSGWNTPIFRVPSGSSNVRFTGLFLEGEAAGVDTGWSESTYKVGIWCDGASGFQVDNCELYGFAYADVYCAGCPTGSGAPYLHHNYVHGSWNKNEGYGFNVGKNGDMICDANIYDCNRHDVTSDGDTGDRFTVKNSIITGNGFLTIGRAHIDMHGGQGDVGRDTSGIEYQVYNCTFEPGSSQLCIHQRGKPQTSARIHHNLFAGDSGGAGFNGSPVCQDCDSSCGNMDIHDNYWAEGGVSASLPSNQFYSGASGIIQINNV